MNIGSTPSVSPLPTQTAAAASQQAGTQALVNALTKIEGQAAVQLIQSVPQANGRIGSNINVSV